MIDIFDVLELHERLIDEFGGEKGVRDYSLLESALARPFQTFDNKEFFPSIEQKASVLLDGIIRNHPFIDGNKRTAYTVYRAYLMTNGYDIDASQNKKYELVIGIAKSDISLDASSNGQKLN
jgi:death-on-curing protein